MLVRDSADNVALSLNRHLQSVSPSPALYYREKRDTRFTRLPCSWRWLCDIVSSKELISSLRWPPPPKTVSQVIPIFSLPGS